MKTKITIFIGAVALITLSSTFASVDGQKNRAPEELNLSDVAAPVGGIMSDEVVK